MIMLLLAAVSFVGTHFLLSHPLRAPIVKAVGEPAFLGVYSLVAAATLGWTVVAYLHVPATGLLWPVGDTLWAIATVLMLIASILFAGSLIGNPAFPQPGAAQADLAPARGVYAVTRHPMMWSFAIWGFTHALIFPMPQNFILTAAVVVLALVGAAFQDQKKERLQPTRWPLWEHQTSYVPFAAIVAGRAKLGGFGMIALLGGLVLWLAATWAHMPLAGWAAGIWRWL